MRHRKRSAAITLVLAGAMSGCGETQPQQDVYRSLADCQRDWASAQQQCQPVTDGRYNRTWYYGPSYFGERYPNGQPRPSPMAVEAFRTQKPTQIASAPRSYWSSGSSSRDSFFSSSSGSRSSGSSISRGGFGSSSRSSSS